MLSSVLLTGHLIGVAAGLAATSFFCLRPQSSVRYVTWSLAFVTITGIGLVMLNPAVGLATYCKLGILVAVCGYAVVLSRRSNIGLAARLVVLGGWIIVIMVSVIQ